MKVVIIVRKKYKVLEWINNESILFFKLIKFILINDIKNFLCSFIKFILLY